MRRLRTLSSIQIRSSSWTRAISQSGACCGPITIRIYTEYINHPLYQCTPGVYKGDPDTFETSKKNSEMPNMQPYVGIGGDTHELGVRFKFTFTWTLIWA